MTICEAYLRNYIRCLTLVAVCCQADFTRPQAMLQMAKLFCINCASEKLVHPLEIYQCTAPPTTHGTFLIDRPLKKNLSHSLEARRIFF
jgi:hypothetical protein